MNTKFSDYVLRKENAEDRAVPVQNLDTKSTQLAADPKYPALSQQMPTSTGGATTGTNQSMSDKLHDDHVKQTFINYINKAFAELAKSNVSPEKAKNILSSVVQEMMKVTGLTQSQAKTVIGKIK